MKKILKYDSKDFSSNINYFLSKNRGVNADITDEVKIIIDSIIDKGDKALNDLTLKYDDFDILKYCILVEEDENILRILKIANDKPKIRNRNISGCCNAVKIRSSTSVFVLLARAFRRAIINLAKKSLINL